MSDEQTIPACGPGSAGFLQQPAKRESRYRALFHTVPDAIVVCDAETKQILDVNEAAVQLYGYSREEFLQRTVLAITDEPETTDQAIARAVAERIVHVPMRRHRKKDGTVFPVEVSGGTYRRDGRIILCAVVRDISPRVELERRLAQARTMDAVGMLAGGVAHDFRNQLTVILGYANMLLRNAGEDDPHRPRIEEILRAAEKASRLTDELLSFGRRQMLQPCVVDLCELAEGLPELLGHVLGEDIRTTVRVPARAACIRVDPARLRQALVEMALHARAAMPTGGELHIAVERVDLGEQFTGPHDLPAGPFARISLRDTGRGMDAETAARIFEPFFTPGDPPEGGGLGLSMVYGFVRQSGGIVECDSTPGEGTRFSMYFPLVAGKPAAGPGDPGRAGPGGTQRVLIVEDDPLVRRFLADAFEGAGYAVHTCRRAEDALARVGEEPRRYDLLITDVVLPGISGVELVARLRRSAPHLPVLYVSGYPAADLTRRGLDLAAGSLLTKPFTREELLQAARSLLEAL